MAAFIACNHLDGLSPLAAPTEDFDDLQLVDVRTDAEVSKMRLPNAIHIPVDELRERLGELDPSKPTVVHCHSGLRSHVATRMLKEHGFQDVTNVTGGIFLQQYVRPERILRD
jgi:rhodanese-related sulfurtransferase